LRLDITSPITLDYDSYLLISINNDERRVLLFDTRSYTVDAVCGASSFELRFDHPVVLAFGTYSINVAYFCKGVVVEHLPGVCAFEVVSRHSREDTGADFAIDLRLRIVS
jgi:hypothetical protein